MNFKSFELNVVVLFTLLLVITFIVFIALHGKVVRLYYDCFRLFGIYVYPFLEFYLLYCYMQLMRARNEIKMNGSCNCQFLYQ